MDHDLDQELGELKVQTLKAIEPLFHPTNDWFKKWQGGTYFAIFARPSKRIRAILDIEREILIAGNVYYEQQARSLTFAKQQIAESNGRLEPKVFLIVHCDPKGNSKLKKWGRQQGITVIPIYARNGLVPVGTEFERALSFELFSQDPFDVTGPVETDSQFFGRRTEAQELARKLQSGQIRAHLGIRKIGKTSITHRVLKEVRENYECDIIFIDCQMDSIFSLNAAMLTNSIAVMMEQFKDSPDGGVRNLFPVMQTISMAEAAKKLATACAELHRPCIVAFDEIDYVTPGSPTAPHWKNDFIEFWRNIRGVYQAAVRSDKKLSIFVCGVSSKWFSVESIDGVENAALSFIPEEYLSPLPRGASVAMIKNIGAMAGLQFDEGAANYISAACSDMPFWIRKACSYLHSRTDTAARPIELTEADVHPTIDQFVQNDGASLASVALQHLFRVYPELQAVATNCVDGSSADMSGRHAKVLQKYGILNVDGKLRGTMIQQGLLQIGSATASTTPENNGGISASLKLAPSDWLEEIQIIGRRRNMIEKKLREVVFNFLRFVSLADNSKSSKELILSSFESKRREELSAYKLEEISERIYWRELISAITKNWDVFSKVFHDKRLLTENADLINDRPDAHAKEIDLADVALYRRALDWFEKRLDDI